MLSNVSRRVLLQKTAQRVGATTSNRTAIASSTLSSSQQIQWNGGTSTVAIRHWSASPKQGDSSDKKSDDQQQREGGESLKDTVRRMGGGKTQMDESSVDPRLNEFVRTATSAWSSFSEEVGKAWDDLLRSGERKDINKKIRHPHDTADGDRDYTGPVAIMVIDETENLSAWERMQKRLTDAPIIQGRSPISAVEACRC